MTHRQSLWASMVVLCLSAPPVPADIGPAAVEIFTDPAFPASGAHALRPQGVPIDIFDLSAPRRIEAVLSAGLPANEAAALADRPAAARRAGQWACGAVAGGLRRPCPSTELRPHALSRDRVRPG
ncbi:MAG: hypothetical protein LOY00_08115 [Methylocaldum sp.]|jgi:hypothetical protein|nr:hypothetical protein [Methylocaldum sp. RMAD-M]MDV3241725.1 hypothetical protein [Methylocaldum sp.]